MGGGTGGIFGNTRGSRENTIGEASPAELVGTQKLTRSKKSFARLVESIRKNGISDTIKYVEHNGVKYVVDGHHRLRAAKLLGLKKIPIEKVILPYRSYKVIEDLFWY